jgi:SAM-dependent methyltransferase
MRPAVQIFATDIDEGAIAVARQGYYTLNDAADVSPDRLRRFFIKEGDGYRVRRELREMILFAAHNFLKDPPFSRLDMVTCRNVLIYLNNIAQERVMETFHFALKPGGYLFLGTSESVDGASDLYATVSREHHIFRAREATSRHYPVPESAPKHLLEATAQPTQSEKESRPLTRSSFAELHQKLLEEYAPPSVVINEEYEIVHLSETVGKYFEFKAGEPTQNLLKLVRPEIRLELRTALYQAVQKRTAVESRRLKVAVDGEVHSINLHIRPVLATASTSWGFILVIFEPAEKSRMRGRWWYHLTSRWPNNWKKS